jgi:voltage-gated potassium channel
MMSAMTMSRVEQWERRSEVPLLLLAVAFLVAYVWPVLDPLLPRDARSLLDVVSWTVWAAFAVDFAIRIALADRRGLYILRHWYDVLLVAIPLLRPMRLLRLLAFVRVLNRTAAGSLAGRATAYVIGLAVVAVGLGSVAVLDVERGDPKANITTFGDALWWATSTVTTVGYGDRFPVTLEGRLIAFALMLVGISLVGVVTASVAAWLVANVERPPDRADAGPTADRGT